MGKISKTSALLLILLFLTSSVLMTHTTVKAQSKTIIVPDDYSTIQSAINHANNGDTVFVKTGYYPETLVINKSISVIGQDRNHTLIDARGMGNSVVYINEANYVTFQNFTLGNSREILPTHSGSGLDTIDGIRLGFRVDYINILNNTIIDIPFGNGIKSQSTTSNTTINGNLILNCRVYAISIGGNGNFVTNNQYSNVYEGISVTRPDNPPIWEENTVEGNQQITITENVSPFPSITPTASLSPSPTINTGPHTEPFPILLLVAVSILTVVVVFSIIALKRHRKTSDTKQ